MEENSTELIEQILEKILESSRRYEWILLSRNFFFFTIKSNLSNSDQKKKNFWIKKIRFAIFIPATQVRLRPYRFLIFVLLIPIRSSKMLQSRSNKGSAI